MGCCRNSVNDDGRGSFSSVSIDSNEEDKEQKLAKVVKKLKEKDPLSENDIRYLKNDRMEFGGTVLELAVRQKTPEKEESLKLLLEEEVVRVLIDIPNNDGETPLHIAAKECERFELVKILLEKEADPNARDQSGKTFLHHLGETENIAQLSEYVTQLNEYVTFIDVNALNNEGEKTVLQDQQAVLSSAQDQHAGSSSAQDQPTGSSSAQNQPAGSPSVQDQQAGSSSSGGHASKMKRRSKLYNLLMGKDYLDLIDELNSFQEPTNLSFYVGNRKLICFVLNLMQPNDPTNVKTLAPIVSTLLEHKVDPLSWDNQGRESAVELALMKDQWDLFKQMIDQLGPNPNLDEISFALLRRTFMVPFDTDPGKSEDETMRKLKFVFETCGDSIKVNQKNPKVSSSKESALLIAAKCSYSRVIVYLLTKGATLNNENQEAVMAALTPEDIHEVLDNPIAFSIKSMGSEPQVEATLDYTFLVNHKEDSETYVASSTAEMVMYLCKNYSHATSHPLVWAYTAVKWSKLEYWKWMLPPLEIIFNIILMLMFTKLVWLISEDKDPTESLNDGKLWKWTSLVMLGIYIIVDAAKFVLFCNSLWPLRSQIPVLTHVSIGFVIKVSMILVCWDFTSRQCTAWIVLVAWFLSAISFMDRVEQLNHINVLLLKTLDQIWKLLLFTLFLLIGFTFGFSIVVPENSNATSIFNHNNPLAALPHLIMMAVGEFEYEAFREEMMKEGMVPVGVTLLFLVFVLVVFLVIMTAMTGSVLFETKEILKNTETNIEKRHLEHIYLFEKLSEQFYSQQTFINCSCRKKEEKSPPVKAQIKVDLSTGDASLACCEESFPLSKATKKKLRQKLNELKRSRNQGDAAHQQSTATNRQ